MNRIQNFGIQFFKRIRRRSLLVLQQCTRTIPLRSFKSFVVAISTNDRTTIKVEGPLWTRAARDDHVCHEVYIYFVSFWLFQIVRRYYLRWILSVMYMQTINRLDSQANSFGSCEMPNKAHGKKYNHINLFLNYVLYMQIRAKHFYGYFKFGITHRFKTYRSVSFVIYLL